MAGARLKLHEDWPTRDVGFWCPGCGEAHWVPTAGAKAWAWNGSIEAPTLSPSLFRQGFPRDLGQVTICHLFLRDGRIQFLPDSQHALAGQTVDAPLVAEWPIGAEGADG